MIEKSKLEQWLKTLRNHPDLQVAIYGSTLVAFELTGDRIGGSASLEIGGLPGIALRTNTNDPNDKESDSK
jgi:hypothetical protein